MVIAYLLFAISFSMAIQSGKHLRSSEKSMVIALKELFEKEMQEGVVLLDKPVLRVAEATGMNKRTVYRILKKYRGRRDLLRSRKNHSRPVKEYADNFQEGVIRRRIHKFYIDKVFPASICFSW